MLEQLLSLAAAEPWLSAAAILILGLVVACAVLNVINQGYDGGW